MDKKTRVESVFRGLIVLTRTSSPSILFRIVQAAVQGDMPALDVLPRSERIQTIHGLWFLKAISTDTLRALLTEWYIDAESTRQLRLRDWLDMLRAVDWITPETERPTEDLVVYRGCEEPYWQRVSWTLDKAKASFFADRWSRIGHPGVVYQAIISPKHVFGIEYGRKEAEVILNPHGLRKRQIIQA